LPISIYEIELELLARIKFEEIKKYGADNVTMVDSDMTVSQMEDELASILSSQQGEEVSPDQALAELNS